MPHSISLIVAIMAVPLAIFQPAEAAEPGLDIVLFKSGLELRGTVVHVDAERVTVQRGDLYQTFAKGLVRRIDDTATTGSYFSAARQSLPPWRAIANDLRSNEGIGRLELVEQGREDFANAKDVPFTRFRMNGEADLVIFGHPDRPAGLLIGLRGCKAHRKSERLRLRSFLAGFLTEPRELSALYDLDLAGGTRETGRLTLSFSTQRRGDLRWWMAAWSPGDLAGAQQAPLPGDVLRGLGAYGGGFYRDRDGRIRAIEAELAGE